MLRVTVASTLPRTRRPGKHRCERGRPESTCFSSRTKADPQAHKNSGASTAGTFESPARGQDNNGFICADKRRQQRTTYNCPTKKKHVMQTDRQKRRNASFLYSLVAGARQTPNSAGGPLYTLGVTDWPLNYTVSVSKRYNRR